MRKSRAIELLGGTTASAAKEIGVTYQAIDKWPDDLPPRLADRVLAAVARKHLPPELQGEVPSAARKTNKRRVKDVDPLPSL